ncbi:MAG: hypothetical protein ABEH77_02655 [Halobacteriaceae archaeon]
MSAADRFPRESLEAAGPVSFVLGGLAILVNVFLEFVSAGAVPGWVNVLLGLGGVWVVSVGLVGVYPPFSESAPRLALGGAVTGALGLVALTAGLGWAVVLALTTKTTVAEGPPLATQIFASALGLALLSSLCYGVASSRTGRPSRTVGLLFLIPFVAFIAVILFALGSNLYGIEPPGAVAFALVGVPAVGLIAVGYALRTGYAPLDPAEPTDTTP